MKKDIRQSIGLKGPAYLPSSSCVLFLLQLVDLLDVAVGDLLHLVEAFLLVVLGDLVVLQELLQPVVRVAADLADAVAAFFGQLVDVPGQLLAALFGERRDRNADDLAVVRRD